MYHIFKKFHRRLFPIVSIAILIGFMTSCSSNNTLSTDETVIQVKNSIRYQNGVIEFTLPSDYPNDKDYDIKISGSYNEKDTVNTVEYLQEENDEKKWVCGNTYKIKLDQVNYTELQMLIGMKSSKTVKESIDLLSFIPSLPSGSETDSASQTLAGRIVIEENILHFDEVEVVFREDTERIEALGLEEQRDYPSGYAIINPEIKEVTYSLTDETTYTFTDLELYFVSEEERMELYTTKSKDEFLKHLGNLNSYPLEEQKIVYYIEVKDGKVISIIENFAFTI